MTEHTNTATPPEPVSRFSDWRYFDSVRTRRIMAFFIDYLMVIALIVISIPIIALLGAATLGAGWLLYTILGPLVALIYMGWTLGSPKQATIGMRFFDLKLERYDGAPMDFVTGVVHAVLYWASVALLTPFIVLVALFARDKRMLHDIVLGTVVVRNSI